MNAQALAIRIADEHPLTPGYNEVNRCRFCEAPWCESTFDEYLENHTILSINPDAQNPRGLGLLKFMHHESDCIWIEASKIVRELDK